MTDLRAALGAQRTAGEQRRHRHRWEYHHTDIVDGAPVTRRKCRCGALEDTTKTRRGKSASRLGKRAERRIERLYGPVKVGEFGDAVDNVGRVFKWQSKATRAELPGWVTDLRAWGPIKSHRWITDPINHMAPLRRDLAPLLIRSWNRQGVKPVDIIIVRSSDWAAIHGGPAPSSEYMAMTGSYFLDIHGTDAPEQHPDELEAERMYADRRIGGPR